MIIKGVQGETIVRDYMISLWTLQDSFITVLKGINLDVRGTLEEPIMTLVDDGTQELSFSIPMYIDNERGEHIENPIWYNVINGNLIANMRKLKVIFNVSTDDEAIFEFLITKVVEKHEDEKLMCEITAEGLAFHELGKQGYRIALNYDTFYKVYDAWEQDKDRDDDAMPISNLQFWNEAMGINSLPINPEPNIWYYRIDMDWSSYANASGKDSNKVYEEEYVESWVVENGQVSPGPITDTQEKARIVDLSNSNYYNLTQDLAKEFGVFCRYEYSYDDNYHIIGRTVVYYNNFINEQEGTIDLSYPYSSQNITREMDGTDIVTKMYVDTVTDEETLESEISIMNTETNLSGEDYLLNFDYLYSIGAISKEQYDGIRTYEEEMCKLNRQYVAISEALISYEKEKVEVDAKLSIAKEGIQAANTGMDEIAAEKKVLDIADGVEDELITAPVRSMVLTINSDNTYSLKLSEKGIIFSSLKIYKTCNMATNECSNPVSLGTPVNDEFGNLIRVDNLSYSGATNIVYVQYNYSPQLYYQRVIDTWNARLAKDQAIKEASEDRLADLNDAIADYNEQKQIILEAKENLRKDFAKLMGPALREGSWTPDNYKNCEDRITTIVQFSELNWDEPLDEELTSTYKLGLEQNEIYYPYIELTGSILTYVQNHIDEQISLIYYDYELLEGEHEYDLARSRRIPLGSGCKLGFLDDETPVIVITAAKTMSEIELEYLKETGILGVFSITEGEHGLEYSITSSVSIKTTISDIEYSLIIDDNSYDLVYPRFIIDNLQIKTGEGSVYVRYNDVLLKEYYDYSAFEHDSKYYITLKPEAILRQQILSGNVYLSYLISNASTAIYLDAKEVLKENSSPKVSYTIDPSSMNQNFMHTAYKQLNRIVNINDYELKFENVQGYISKLELHLDAPYEDSIEIKNYKTKFEDLFTSIVASTEQMQKNANTYYSVSQVLNPDGTIKASSLQKGINNIDLNYAFNNGNLTISNENGIWGISDGGVVAMRGGGIFTATDKDINGDWIWNTGITPQGINAQLITCGQLDTNRVVIYAGDEVKFQLNDSGLYAYKSYIGDNIAQLYLSEDYNEIEEDETEEEEITLTEISWDTDEEKLTYFSNVNRGQYVVHNSDGLFLHVDEGTKVLDIIRDDDYEIQEIKAIEAPCTVDRVAISWEGLVLRNWENKPVFYADHLGNLTLEGKLKSKEGEIAGWHINENFLQSQIDNNNSMIISAETGINFNEKFKVTQYGAVEINDGNTILKNSASSIGFYDTNDNAKLIIDSNGYIQASNLYISADNLHLVTNNTSTSLSSTFSNFTQNINDAQSTANDAQTYANQIHDGTITVPHVKTTGIEIKTVTVDNETYGIINIGAHGEETGKGEINIAANSSLKLMSDSSNSAIILNKDGITLASGKNLAIVNSSGNNAILLNESGITLASDRDLVIDTNNMIINTTPASLSGNFSAGTEQIIFGVGDIKAITPTSYVKYVKKYTNNNDTQHYSYILSIKGALEATSLTVGSGNNTLTYNGSTLTVKGSGIFTGTIHATGGEFGSTSGAYLNIDGNNIKCNGGLAITGNTISLGNISTALSIADGALNVWGGSAGSPNAAHLAVKENTTAISGGGNAVTVSSTEVGIKGPLGFTEVTDNSKHTIKRTVAEGFSVTNNYATSYTYQDSQGNTITINFTNAADLWIDGTENTTDHNDLHIKRGNDSIGDPTTITLVTVGMTVNAKINSKTIASTTVSNGNATVEYDSNRNITSSTDNGEVWYNIPILINGSQTSTFSIRQSSLPT